MLCLAQGVVEKPYKECTQSELTEAYRELFGIIPCAKCNSIDWSGVHRSIIKQYNTLKTLNANMGNLKYVWNPVHKGVRTFISGRSVDSNTTDQTLLEIIFNDPKRQGLVILNPDYLPEEAIKDEFSKVEKVNITDKEKVRELFSKGYSKNRIKKETGISPAKIKQYLE